MFIAILLLILSGLFYNPSKVLAVDYCYSYISTQDTELINGQTYPRIRVNVQNNGTENVKRVILRSVPYSAEKLVCPAGYSGNTGNPFAPYCYKNENINPYEVIIPTLTFSGQNRSQLPTTISNHGTSTVATVFNDWNNPTNLGAEDAQYTDINYTGGAIPFVDAKDFGNWNIPETATISAIMIEVKGYATGDFTAHHVGLNLSRDDFVTRQINGVNNDLLWVNLPASSTVHTYTTDTTQTNFNNYQWQPSDFNDGLFGLALYADQGNAHHYYIDYVRVSVTYIQNFDSRYDVYLGDGTNEYHCMLNALGNLTPIPPVIPETPAIDVPVSCADTDIFCKGKVWIYTLFNNFFGIDPQYAIDRYSTFSNETAGKIPFAYVKAITDNFNLITPVASSSAFEDTVPAFDMSFTPKLKVGGGALGDITPVSIHVDSGVFSILDTQREFLYTFWKVIIAIMWGYYVIGLFHRMFK
jgi:hypothetical protein